MCSVLERWLGSGPWGDEGEGEKVHSESGFRDLLMSSALSWEGRGEGSMQGRFHPQKFPEPTEKVRDACVEAAWPQDNDGVPRVSQNLGSNPGSVAELCDLELLPARWGQCCPPCRERVSGSTQHTVGAQRGL